MTDEEKVQLSAYLIQFIRTLEIDWIQYQSGALDETTWSTYEAIITEILSYPRSREWWGFYHAVFLPSFVERTNELIDGVPIRSSLPDVDVFQ